MKPRRAARRSKSWSVSRRPWAARWSPKSCRPGFPFNTTKKPLKKKKISRIINASFRRCGLRETVIFADKLMQAGYSLATRGGISFAADDMLVPAEKHHIIGEAESQVKEIEAQYT